MSTAVSHWFVPHKANGHRAHLLRPVGLGLIAVLLLAVQLGYNLTVTGRPMVLGYATDINVEQLFAQTNQQRTQNGLAPLQLSSTLNQGAQNKAADMFAKDYWSHYAPDGTPPWAFFQAVGYSYSYAGENLAKDFDTSSGVMDGWMNSPGHRANILSPHYTQVGFGVMNGSLLGEQTTLVVAFYGAPLTAPAPPMRATPRPAASAPVAVNPAHTVPAPAPTAPVNSLAFKSAPAPQTFTLFKPLAVSDTLGWGQQLTVALLGLLMLLYLIHHYYATRRKLHKAHHSYSLVQAGLLLVAIIFIAAGSLGSVG